MSNYNNKSNIGWVVVVGVFSMIVGFFLVGLFSEKKISALPPETHQTSSSQKQIPSSQQENQQAMPQQQTEDWVPIITEITTPEFNNSNGTYSFVVRASVPSRDPLVYRVKDKKDNIVVENTDGAFSGVLSSSDEGRYFVEVVNSAHPNMTSGLRSVGGFDAKMEVAPKVARVSKGDLTSKFNTGSYSAGFSGGWEREHLAPGCRFSFSGIKDGEPRPGDIGAICSRIQMGTWSSVEVTSVSYDESNRITYMSLNVKYPEE